MDEIIVTQHVKSSIKTAWLLADQGNLSGAIQSIEEAIQLRPNWSECWVTKGHLLRELKKPVESESALRKALQLNASDHCAWTELGLLFRDIGLFEKAAFCFRHSAEIVPDHNVYTLLANMELTFDLKSAITSAERALALEPNWKEATRIRDAARLQLNKK